MNRKKSSLLSSTILVLSMIVTLLSLVGCATVWNKSKAQQEKIEELHKYATEASTINNILSDTNHNLKTRVNDIELARRELEVMTDAAVQRQKDTQSRLGSVLESLGSVEKDIHQIRTVHDVSETSPVLDATTVSEPGSVKEASTVPAYEKD